MSDSGGGPNSGSSWGHSTEGIQAINYIFQFLYGRNSTVAEFNGVEAYISSGADLNDAWLAVAFGAETTAMLNNIYLGVLGRPIDSGSIYGPEHSFSLRALSLAQERSTVAHSAEAANDISALYQPILGRAADASGLANFENQLAAGTTLSGVRAALANSAEASAAINGLYQSVLGRAVDPSGQANFQSQLANGSNLTAIRTALAYGSEAAADIGALYQSVLGRAVDPAEAANKVNALYQSELGRAASASDLSASQIYLANGGSLSGIATNVANTPEAANKINAIYQSILGRAASATDLSASQIYLANGGSLSGLTSNVAYTAEAANDINSLYIADLGRAADASGLAGFQSLLANGSSMAVVRSDIAYSQEEANDINAIYQAEDGRAIDPSGLASFQSQLAGGLSLDAIRTSVSTSSETTADIQSTMLSIEGVVDTPILQAVEQLLATGGSILLADMLILNSPQVQSGFTLDYEQLLNREPTSQELAAETNEFSAKISAVVSLDWASLATNVSNAVLSFLGEVNPIGSAEAAASQTPTAQQLSQRTIAANLLLNKNLSAIMKTFSTVENFGQYNSNNYLYEYGDKPGHPSGTKADFATAFPAAAASRTYSASGAYALTHGTYLFFQNKLGLSDYQPATQDLVGVYDFYKTGGAAALMTHATPTLADFNAALFDGAHQWSAAPGGPLSPFGTEHSVIPNSHPLAPYTYEQFIALYKSFGGTGSGF